jgi:hypothetical protein
MLMADVNWSLGTSQDLGIAVASTSTPTSIASGVSGDTRKNFSYEYIGIRGDSWHVISSGFDGATTIPTSQFQPGTGTTVGLFIARTSAQTFDFGYNQGAGNVVLSSFTFTNSDIGNAIGFYTDMRANNSVGTLDNLRLAAVPEPSTLALCGLAFAGFFYFIRHKKHAIA